MRKIVTLVCALFVTSCWAQKPVSDSARPSSYGACIICGGSVSGINKDERFAIRAMREIARYAGFKIVSTIERGGTAMHPELTKKDKQKCRKAIEKLYI